MAYIVDFTGSGSSALTCMEVRVLFRALTALLLIVDIENQKDYIAITMPTQEG